MRIAVCIKQVPVVAALSFDIASKTLKRAGVPTEVSSFDIRALLKAVELRQIHGGEVTVVTMGPPQAREALEHCLALGGDTALHLCDEAFAGSDTLATARALALALRPRCFDLILCGRSSVDAETGQVGPELAELLDLPQITAAFSIDIEPGSTEVRVERELDDGTEIVSAALPCLITAAENLAPERFPSRAEREAAKAKPYIRLSATDLSPDLAVFGAQGSPTWVSALESMAVPRRMTMIAAPSIAESAAELAERLIADHGLFDPPAERKTVTSHRIASVDSGVATGAVWIVVEDRAGELRTVSYELLHTGRALADALGTDLCAVSFSPVAASYAEAVGTAGADRLLIARDSLFYPIDVEICASSLAVAIQAASPWIVLAPSTSLGRDLMPRLAARLGLGLTGDCVDLGLDREGGLIQYKPAFGGSVVAPILSRTRPQLATIRPGMLSLKNTEVPLRTATLEVLEWPANARRRVSVLERTASAAHATDLDSADIVVGIGKGLGEWERFEIIQPLIEELGASVCATRDVTDAGWLPKQYQVGITGRAISPRIYIAIGIRGAFDHMVGVRGSGVIVAINNNPKAPIFKAADYGIVGDFSEVVPALKEALASQLAARQPAAL